VDAREAERIGLFNHVYPRASLLAEAEALLRKMLANSPIGLRFTLEAVRGGLDMSLEDGLLHEATLFGLICATEDMQEGTRAFLEKREAKFQGR
jgi:enoyl-CoA hydratase